MSQLQQQMQQVLEEVEKTAKDAQWKASEAVKQMQVEHPHLKTAGYEADKEGWHFVVVGFDLEPQGYPPGSRGYDGAAKHEERSIILHLTRELAEKFYKAAEAQVA